MAWPPAPSTGYIAEGVTNIRWGTEGTQFNGFAAIVKSIRANDRVQEFTVENGTGLTATEILLDDGVDYEITIVDQATLPAPSIGDVVALDNPLDGVSDMSFLVCNNNYNAARKQDGERVILAKAFTLISL